MADGDRSKKGDALSAVQSGAIKERMTGVCSSFKFLALASDAVKAAYRVEDAADRKVLCEAADYYQETFENELDVQLELLCKALGMDYRSAQDMQIRAGAES